MSDFQAIADRVEIEALRGEFTDAAMMRDRARLASLFTPDGVVQAIRAVVNPDKLGHIGPVSDVARLPEKELPQHR